MGELLDQAIRLYRANFLKFIGIFALVEIPVGLLQILSATTMLSGAVNMTSTIKASPDSAASFGNMLQYLGGAGASLLVSVLSFFLVSGIGTAALTRAIADGYMGEPVEILGSYRKIGKRWLSLLGAMLLVALLIVGASIWLAIPCIGWLTGPGLLIFLSIVIIPLLGPIVVLEQAPATAAVRRAWDLGRARFWWLIGYVGILFIFNLLIISGPVALLNSLVVAPLQRQSMLAGSATQAFVMTTILQQSLSILLSIFYHSLQAIAITLAYFDLRTRLEGFDLAVQTLSPGQSIVEQLAQAPKAQATPRLIEWNDVLRFLLLSLIVAGIYIVVFGIMFAAIGLGTAGLGGLK
jgi:hypothetical protein